MVHSAFRMLLGPSSPFATDSGESSSSAIICGQSDELSESAAIPGDSGDDLMSNEMATHVTFRRENEEEVPLMSKKGGNNARDPANSFENGPSRDAELLIDEFMRFHPPPPYSKYPITGNLPCPVIIPQRRPRDWKRGFMRAYAPVLGDCGVSQDMFLDFLKTFDAVNKQLPLLQVINAAAFNVIHLPIITLIASTAVDFALEARAQSRTNTFLYRTNKEFFQPRGLYCLIMTYDPKSKETFTSVDITRSVSSVMKAKSSALRWMLLMSISSHSLELPEAAPLVYPIMDLGDPHHHPIRWTLKTMGNYFDRREQAKYARKRPPKALTAMAPTEQRAESWLRVRTVNPYPTSEVSEALDTQGRVTNYVEPGKRKEKPNKGTGRRWFKENVLYMMIVNMPTEADLAAVKGST